MPKAFTLIFILLLYSHILIGKSPKNNISVLDLDVVGNSKIERLTSSGDLLEGSGGIKIYPDPAEAEEGTVRKLYAESKQRNTIHASDSDENAAREISFFFPETDVISNK